MYIIPNYVLIKNEENKKITLSSMLEGTEIALKEEKYISEFWNIYRNGVKKVNTELTCFLNQYNMLIEENTLSETVKTVIDKVASEFFKVTVMPTEQCNFRCTYCYEQFKYGTMDENIINHIRKFIKAKLETGKYKEFMLDWFGGEPTLACVDVLTSLTNFTKSLCDKRNINFISEMTTNAYLLSVSRFLEYLSAGITFFQITIDGLKHDETRRFCDGQGTFDTIIENIKDIHALSCDYKFSIILRYNVLPNNQDTAWYEYLGKILQGDERFSVLIRPVSDLGGEKVKCLTRFSAKEWEKNIKFHIEKATEAGLKVANLSEKRPFGKACFASFENTYIFRANGDVVKCSSHIDDEINVIGKVDADKGVLIDGEKNNRWSSFLPEKECFSCAEFGACLNRDCPYLRLSHQTLIYCNKSRGIL